MYGPDREIRDILGTFIATEYEGQRGVLAWLTDISKIKAAEDEMRRAKEWWSRGRLLCLAPLR
jgi:two-component system sensor histidine kinase/response regulator